MASKKTKDPVEHFFIVDTENFTRFASVSEAEKTISDCFERGDYEDDDVVFVVKAVRRVRCKRTVEGEDV